MHPPSSVGSNYSFITQSLTTAIEQDVNLWKGLQPEFLKNLDKVNADLKAAGLPALK